MIIIETTTRERLVLVPEDRIVCTEHARDATPADLERAGYVPSEEMPSALKRRADDWQRKAESLLARVEKAEAHAAELHERCETLRVERNAAQDRAEKAEVHIKSLHDAEQTTRRILDAALGELIVDAAARLHNDWVDTRERAEQAERELVEALRAVGQHARNYDDLKESLGNVSKRRDEAIARAEKAERERDDARAELARLTAVGEGEPTDEELDALLRVDSSSDMTNIVRARIVWRAGVARERARQARTEPRATDEELLAIADAVYEEAHGGEILNGPHEIARRVAARVRGERCLVAQAVGMGEGFSVTRRATGAEWRIRLVGGPGAECTAADVPATLARLLGEVSRG